MYMGRLVSEPNDIMIFGRAVALAHRDGVDVASDAEIARRPWKQRWSNYIRIQYPEFLDIRLGDGISLQNMKAELGSDAFASTQKNAEKREGNTEPTRSIMQKAHMKLTREARSWLDMRFDHTAQRQGIVDTSRPRFAAPSDA